MCTCLTGLPEFFLAGPSLRNAQLGRLTNHHRDALMIERLAIRASQGDFVGAGPERELCKGGRVKSRKQAIAIGLSEARKKGAKVPSRRSPSSRRRSRSSR